MKISFREEDALDYGPVRPLASSDLEYQTEEVIKSAAGP